jgi:hypothetical protein
VSLQLGVYICSKCDQGLPAWEQLLLGVVGVVIAFGLLYGLTRLGAVRGRWRDMQLRTCFLGVQRAWSAGDADRLLPFVTAALGDQLRRQLTGILAAGQAIHHERPRVKRLRVLSGGGRRDAECVARIESSVRHWITDAGSGALLSGSRDVSHDEALWRFVRDPKRGWLAAEIGVSA